MENTKETQNNVENKRQVGIGCCYEAKTTYKYVTFTVISSRYNTLLCKGSSFNNPIKLIIITLSTLYIPLYMYPIYIIYDKQDGLGLSNRYDWADLSYRNKLSREIQGLRKQTNAREITYNLVHANNAEMILFYQKNVGDGETMRITLCFSTRYYMFSVFYTWNSVGFV